LRTDARPAGRTGRVYSSSSRLSEAAEREYHYVGRDLRNIGVLVAIMAVILVVAFVLFNVLGITATTA
jgi:hypothetical protein